MKFKLRHKRYWVKFVLLGGVLVIGVIGLLLYLRLTQWVSYQPSCLPLRQAKINLPHGYKMGSHGEQPIADGTDCSATLNGDSLMTRECLVPFGYPVAPDSTQDPITTGLHNMITFQAFDLNECPEDKPTDKQTLQLFQTDLSAFMAKRYGSPYFGQDLGTINVNNHVIYRFRASSDPDAQITYFAKVNQRVYQINTAPISSTIKGNRLLSEKEISDFRQTNEEVVKKFFSSF